MIESWLLDKFDAFEDENVQTVSLSLSVNQLKRMERIETIRLSVGLRRFVWFESSVIINEYAL